MRLFVTGGAGFVGSNFIRHWMRAHPDDTVVNFDALTYAGNPENLTDCARDSRYAFVRGDVADGAAVERAIAGSDVAVHFAAETHVDRSLKDAAPFLKTNVLGTYVLGTAALRAGVRKFIHISTDEVFGALELDDRRAFDEASRYAPRNPYAASKAASDFLVRSLRDSFGLPAIVTNCGNNYGPFQFPEKFIPVAVAAALAGAPVPVYGDGRYVRSWIHVEDHCRAIAAIVERGVVGETYCIGGTELENIEVARRILALAGQPHDRIAHVPDRPGHDRRYAINDAKLRRELGWEPKYAFDDGLRETVAWYRENGAWVKSARARGAFGDGAGSGKAI